MNNRSTLGVKARVSRRDFLKKTAATAATTTLGSLDIARNAHAAGNGIIKVGLVGCGGRGTAAAINALNSGPDVRLVALADIFDERLQQSLERLKKAKPNQVQVKNDNCFIGFDAYEKLIASGVDVVLIAPASHFIPQILKAAVDAGKHVFCEKPHGIDMPGVAVCEAASEVARTKKLSLVSGLCWRYDEGVRETMNVQEPVAGL